MSNETKLVVTKNKRIHKIIIDGGGNRLSNEACNLDQAIFTQYYDGLEAGMSDDVFCKRCFKGELSSDFTATVPFRGV
jgi:hypothetical protein